MLTLNEQERAAYIAGDTRTAALLAQVSDLEAQADWLCRIEDKGLADLDDADAPEEVVEFIRDVVKLEVEAILELA